MHPPHKVSRHPPVKGVGLGLQTHHELACRVRVDAMSEPDNNQQQPARNVSGDGTPRRPAGSGEGLDSVITRLREQEDQRVQNDPTTGISRSGN